MGSKNKHTYKQESFLLQCAEWPVGDKSQGGLNPLWLSGWDTVVDWIRIMQRWKEVGTFERCWEVKNS